MRDVIWPVQLVTLWCPLYYTVFVHMEILNMVDFSYPPD
jgi:hypothetical protein